MAGGDNDYFDNSLDVRSLETPDKHAAIFLQLRVPALYSKISSALTAAGPIGKGYISVASGTYTESTDLTVPTGVTLDMTAGGTLQMADDKQIIVNGTFNARNATLTASANDWDGIRFNSGSGGEIYNCNLYKCGYPYYIYIYNASPTIRANTLTQWAGAYHGIYVRGSTADPTLYDNDIEINYTGVRFDNYAAGELSYNLIHVTNMYDPVLYAVGGAWVDADYRGANTFREGRYGISAQSSARVDASGTFSENDFCETGVYDLYATSSSSIYANYCNFPGASPTTYADGTSTITTQYASNSDGYCSQLSKANTLAGLESPRGEPLHPVDLAALSPLDRAWHGLKTGQLAAAEADFLALLETDAAHQALTGLAHVYTRNQSPAIFSTITRLATTTGPLQAHAMEVESHCYVIQGEEQKALTTAKELAERFPESEYGFQSRITAMYMHYHRGELAPAAELLAETTARNETDAATIRMIHHVLERAGANVTALAVEKATPLSEASHPWDETVVVAPNPYDVGSGTQSLQFFHLPTSARIQLYDVAGRHRLTTASQGANAALTLSAQDYPAGVYLYVVEELDGADGTPTGKRTTGKFVVVQ